MNGDTPWPFSCFPEERNLTPPRGPGQTPRPRPHLAGHRRRVCRHRRHPPLVDRRGPQLLARLAASHVLLLLVARPSSWSLAFPASSCAREPRASTEQAADEPIPATQENRSTAFFPCEKARPDADLWVESGRGSGLAAKRLEIETVFAPGGFHFGLFTWQRVLSPQLVRSAQEPKSLPGADPKRRSTNLGGTHGQRSTRS